MLVSTKGNNPRTLVTLATLVNCNPLALANYFKLTLFIIGKQIGKCLAKQVC